MAKLVDALDSGSSGSNIMRVRVPLAAHMNTTHHYRFHTTILVCCIVLDCLVPYGVILGLIGSMITVPVWMIGLIFFSIIPMCIYGYILVRKLSAQPNIIFTLLVGKLLSVGLIALTIQQIVPGLVFYGLQELTALLLGSGAMALWYAWSRSHTILLRLSMSAFGCGILLAGIGLGLTSYVTYTHQVAIGLWSWIGIWLWIPWLLTSLPLIRNRVIITKS